MGSKTSKPQPYGINSLLKQVDAGDLLLISTNTELDTDVDINPFIANDINFILKNRLCVNTDKQFSEWVSLGIVVEVSLSINSAKYLLELTDEGFVVSELLGRLSELKKKGHKAAVRCLIGNKSYDFRKHLKEITETLSGKRLDELIYMPFVRNIVNVWDEALRVPRPEAPVFRLMKQVFYKHSASSESLQIGKREFANFLKEFTGVRSEADDENVEMYLDGADVIDYETFSKKWSQGPGKTYFEGMLLKESILSAEFVYNFYIESNVLHRSERRPGELLSPEDFTSAEARSARSDLIRLQADFSWEDQKTIDL
mmetsp:Transcript_13227/g.24775  ORF Transcript_13227/g.24775 Transcript_13227/m.24775 type:complete len:314 (+) Transcript_13227:1742-2683(+)